MRQVHAKTSDLQRPEGARQCIGGAVACCGCHGMLTCLQVRNQSPTPRYEATGRAAPAQPQATKPAAAPKTAKPAAAPKATKAKPTPKPSVAALKKAAAASAAQEAPKGFKLPTLNDVVAIRCPDSPHEVSIGKFQTFPRACACCVCLVMWNHVHAPVHSSPPLPCDQLQQTHKARVFVSGLLAGDGHKDRRVRSSPGGAAPEQLKSNKIVLNHPDLFVQKQGRGHVVGADRQEGGGGQRVRHRREAALR